jgi:hypothetical protein
MVSWPDLGTRVTVRYRRPAGSVPPLTDAVGHLLAVDPVVRVRKKTGAVVEFAPADVVALRVLTDAPVRTSQIRALEHAAAAALPGGERAWLDGWLLRAGPGAGLAANSAVPLGISARTSTVPAIVDWYARRGLTPRLAIPDRLLRLPPGVPVEHTERVLVRDVSPGAEPDPSVTLSAGPLPAALDGELVFGSHPGGAVARAVLTEAPDGTRWVGLSEIPAGEEQAATMLCTALLSWGADRGATRGYLIADDTDDTNDTKAMDVADALGFRLHHARRYVRAMDTV